MECPLCMEPFEVDDLHFYPCTCGYQICRFCWNRIREGENGLCPACRKAYPENPADFTPLSQEQVAAIKTEKKAREQKKRTKTLESRRALANVRVVQNNLVFVVGLPVRLADPETLKRQEYFGKYGKIHKVVINQSTTYAGSQGPSASAYVTYVSPADALRAIQGVNNVTLDGRVLKGSLGTTKYCANFMKNQPCPKPDCMYLHEMGDPKASFTKEEMHAGLHQVYERKLHNQLLVATQQGNSSGNSSTGAEKSSSKDGNQSNFIPTTVVTSSHINIVNSSKSKKESGSANGSSNSISNGNSNKEAWPSLSSSPPTAESPTRKQSSPKPQQNGNYGNSSYGYSSNEVWPSLGSSPPTAESPARKRASPKLKPNVKSQENGILENGSQQQSQSKNNKEHHTDHNKSNKSNKENSTNNNKKSKNTDSHRNKQKAGYSDIPQTESNSNVNEEISSVIEMETLQENYLSNELDELESDRHSLLENHDLLDNSDHSLLDDDNTHNLLDANSDVLLMQRHKEMLSGLVDNNHLMHMKTPLTNGFRVLDRESMGYLNSDRQINQGMSDKEVLLRERSRSEMLMRQNEMLARQHNGMVEPKLFMPTSNISLETASELLGANYHPNTSMLPPFGMRVDSSIAANSLSANTLSVNSLPANNMGLNAMSNTIGTPSYLMHNQHLLQNQHQQMQQSAVVNGFDTSHNKEGRYLAENMDKFFTDFHKAQQMRQLVSDRDCHHVEHNEHKHRMASSRSDMGGAHAAGDCDDDLDFDPFKETQKALAEMMESEMKQNNINTGDNLEHIRRTTMPPPGFGHMNAFGIGVPLTQSHMQSFSSQSAAYSDWTQMDPAIVSTSVNFNKNVMQQMASPQSMLSQQQQELFAQFNQLSMTQPNGMTKLTQNGQQLPMLSSLQGSSHLLNGHSQWSVPPQKLAWNVPSYNNIPIPPGFSPPKATQHSAECIDAK